MPWKLIVFIFVFGILLAFITFNLENRCDISFGFATFNDVPVFLTIFFAFVLGLLCTMPFVIRARRNQKDTFIKKKGKTMFSSAYRSGANNSGAGSDGGHNDAE